MTNKGRSELLLQLYRNRVGRISAGIAGILGAAVLAFFTVGFVMVFSSNNDQKPLFAILFLGSIALCLVSYPLSRLFVKSASEQSLIRIERLSIGLPLVGLSLLAPLASHLIISLFFLPFSSGAWLENFGGWVGLSILITGHCHLLLVLLSWLYSGALSQRSVGDFPSLDKKIMQTILLVGLSSALPFFPFCMIVLVPTAALIVPAMFLWARRTIAYERAALELGEDPASFL